MLSNFLLSVAVHRTITFSSGWFVDRVLYIPRIDDVSVSPMGHFWYIWWKHWYMSSDQHAITSTVCLSLYRFGTRRHTFLWSNECRQLNVCTDRSFDEGSMQNNLLGSFYSALLVMHSIIPHLFCAEWNQVRLSPRLSFLIIIRQVDITQSYVELHAIDSVTI